MAMNMRGSLNVSKFQKGSNSPRFYGRCIIDGETYNIKGWEKEGKDGPWISLLFESLEAGEDFEQCVPRQKGLFSTPDEPATMKKPQKPKPVQEWKEDDIPF